MLSNFSRQVILLISTLVIANTALSHGGVSLLDDDICLIKIDFLDAHFTVFQPMENGTKEFCEDLPDATESVFVIDYIHEYLKEIPVEFRIIKDVNEYGYFAQWEDVESMGNLSEHTVFFQRPGIQREGIYTVNHTFEEPGMYIGIVTAHRPGNDTVYRAVFPFQVGASNWGFIPLFILLIIAAQFAYWFVNKRLNAG